MKKLLIILLSFSLNVMAESTYIAPVIKLAKHPAAPIDFSQKKELDSKSTYKVQEKLDQDRFIASEDDEDDFRNPSSESKKVIESLDDDDDRGPSSKSENSNGVKAWKFNPEDDSDSDE